MKSFIQYLRETVDYPETSHVMSGDMPDGTAVEHSYHATIPSQNTPNGTTNLWMSVVSPKQGTEHEFHFGVSDTVTPQMLRAQHQAMSDASTGRSSVAPHEAYYALGDTKSQQGALQYHGSGTMMHVLHHFRNLFANIPKGHSVKLHTGDLGTPEDRARKMGVYQKLAARTVQQLGGTVVSNPDDPFITITKHGQSSTGDLS